MKAVYGAFFVEEGPVRPGERPWTEEDQARLAGRFVLQTANGPVTLPPHVACLGGVVAVNSLKHIEALARIVEARARLFVRVEEARLRCGDLSLRRST